MSGPGVGAALVLALDPGIEPHPDGWKFEGITHDGVHPVIRLRNAFDEVESLSVAEGVSRMALDEGQLSPGPNVVRESLYVDSLLGELNAEQRGRLAFKLAVVGLAFDGEMRTHPCLESPVRLSSGDRGRFPPTGSTESNIDVVMALAAEGRLGMNASGAAPRVSRASLFRWRKLLDRPGGVVNLCDERVLRRWQGLMSQPCVDIMTAIRAYARAQVKRGDKYLRIHRVQCRVLLHNQHAELLCHFSRKQIDDFIDRALREFRLGEPFDRRMSKAMHVPTANLGRQPTGPRQVVAVDATTLKVRCLDVHGRPHARVDVLVAVDAWNHEFLELLLVPGVATAKDVGRLFARLLTRSVFHEGPSTSLLRLPDGIELTPEWNVEALDGVFTDRGSNFIANHNLSALSRLGVSVAIAPPGRGDSKGIVEALIRALSSCWQLQPGHMPRRGKGPSALPQQALLEMADVDLLMRAWGHSVHNARPHDSLRINGTRIKVSPDAMRDAYVDLYGMPARVINLEDIKPMLIVREATLTPQGILVDGETYLDPQGRVHDLRAMRTVVAGGRHGREPRLTVWAEGPYPDCIFVDLQTLGGGGAPLICWSKPARERKAGLHALAGEITNRLLEAELADANKYRLGQERQREIKEEVIVREAQERARKPASFEKGETSAAADDSSPGRWLQAVPDLLVGNLDPADFELSDDPE